MKFLHFSKNLLLGFGKFFMKSMHAFGALVVLICAMSVSFNHTIVMYQNGAGYESLQALVIAVSFEIMFAMSSAVMISRRLKGKQVPKFTKVGFWFGLVVVTWGNIRFSLKPEAGFVGNIEPVLLEIAVVCIVIFSEAIFGEAVTDPDEQPEPETEQSKKKPTTQGDNKPFPEPMPLKQQPRTQRAEQMYTDRQTPEPVAQNVRTPLQVNTQVSRINHLLDEKDKRFMEENKNVFLICAEHLDKTGDYPSIRKLAEIADTKTNRSRRVIDIVKLIQKEQQS
jgi:hypothetical protein